MLKHLLYILILSLILFASAARAHAGDQSENMIWEQDAQTENQQSQQQACPGREYEPGSDMDPGAGMWAGCKETANINGKTEAVRRVVDLSPGVMLPDGKGGKYWLGGNKAMYMPEEAREDAREIKLKVRELADQLLSDYPKTDLETTAVLPVSFVSQDNFDESSSFGRYIAEQMYYEFNQRGFPVREYRMDDQIYGRRGSGEFLLSRANDTLFQEDPNALVLVGTYYYDVNNVFVNARLMRGMDGLVVRTANLVFPLNRTSKKMLDRTGVRLDATFVGIRDYGTMTQKTDLTDIDLGLDVH